jgi:hypothetical protein
MMRSRTAEWFETKIKYEKTMEDGLTKKVTEQYVVDALSFTEAERRIIEEMTNYISGAFDVADIKKATYKEIFFSDAEIVVIVGFAGQMIATNNFNSVLQIDVDKRLLPIIDEFKPATWRENIK